MSLTLDATLQTRLDSRDRQPEIEILSENIIDAIPFQGQSFGIARAGAFKPQLLSHSTGLLGQAYIVSNEVWWMATDTERTQWTVPASTGLCSVTADAEYVTICELANGDIGVVVLGTTGGDERLWTGVIDTAGAVVTALVEVEDLNNTYEWRSPHVIQMTDDDYRMVYIRETTDTAWAIYSRTATTWGTWGGAVDITPAGLDTTEEIDNPSLFEADEGDLFLLVDQVTDVQDDVTIKNIFSSISPDYGSSWGAASARTTYTEFGSNGLDPIMLQRPNGTVWLMFYESVGVLHMDSSATGFVQDGAFGMGVKNLHFDSVNDKIVVTFGNTGLGTKILGGVAIVDKATWSIDKTYYSSSTPAVNSIFSVSNVTPYTHIHADGKYVALCLSYDNGHTVLCVINHLADTVVHYMIDDDGITGITDGLPAYSLPRNVEYNSQPGLGVYSIKVSCVRVDATNDEVYLGWDGGYRRQYYMFSKIDLTDVADGEGMYPMTWITNETDGIVWDNKNRVQFEYPWEFELDLDNNYIIAFSSGGGVTSTYAYNGIVLVLSLDAGAAVVKLFDVYTHGSAPRWGLVHGIVHESAIYGTIYYNSNSPHTDQRGLCKIDYVTDTITYYRPGFASSNQYFFNDFALDSDNDILYAACAWGIAKFSMLSGAWTLFSSDTLPGFVRSGEEDDMGFVQYDSVDQNVMGGSWTDWIEDYLTGINMFNENGAYNQLQYITGDKAVSWTWEAQADLSYYSQEATPTAALDAENVLWVTWNHIDWAQSQNVLYWDNDQGSIDVTADINGSVVLSWQLKRPNALNFRLANGQLYDPQNLLSTKNVVGQKGRKVVVRIGENIGGYVYWVNQGTFLVDTSKMQYKRGRMPSIQIRGVGKTGLWRDQQISVSALYSGTDPDDVIEDLISDFTQLLPTEYDIPTFDDEHSIFYQWIDETVWAVVEELCDHFFYAMYEDVNGVFNPRKVELTQAVDHEYTDDTHLTDFGPDDDYSDYTNRVRVIGEALDYTEVVHDDEIITSKGGTVGWWVKNIDETIYYSEDRERQARNPRLNVVHSPTEYGLLLSQLASGEGGIEIIEVDTYEHYVVVRIRVEDLTAALVAAIIAMITVASYAIRCDGNKRCGAYLWALSIAVSLVFYIIAAVAQYQYELWAHPLGKVKTSIQFEANDEEFQRKIRGEIVTHETTDPLCTTVLECQRVAESSLDIVSAQRRRVTFSKLAHMQDELLDKIKVYHPHSGEGMEILVVGLQRTYNKGQSVIDKVSGWRYIA